MARHPCAGGSSSLRGIGRSYFGRYRFLGGGPDREQKLASEVLLGMREELRTYVEGDGALLAICGGYQILGSNWLMGDESVEGLSILDLKTVRAGAGFDRLIENLRWSPSFLRSRWWDMKTMPCSYEARRVLEAIWQSSFQCGPRQ